MKLTFKLIYQPNDDVSGILRLLDCIKQSDLRIGVTHEVVVDDKHNDRILRTLWPVSVLGKIQIRKSRRGLLYPHLLVYRDGTLSTFYPRRRGREPETTIQQFLHGVLVQNQRNNLVASFFATGRDCIESAKFLYEHRKDRGRYEILFTHGIESILTSFIIFKDDGDPLATIETLKHYRHEYRKFYERCRTLDDTGIFDDENLQYIINDLAVSFFPSTIDARYPKVGPGVVRFMPSYFPLLKQRLIKPLGRLLGLESQRSSQQNETAARSGSGVGGGHHIRVSTKASPRVGPQAV
jgi:hypothetical protein